MITWPYSHAGPHDLTTCPIHDPSLMCREGDRYWCWRCSFDAMVRSGLSPEPVDIESISDEWRAMGWHLRSAARSLHGQSVG